MRTFLATALLLISSVAFADDPPPPQVVCKAMPATMKVSINFAPNTAVSDLGVWLHAITCKPVVFPADVAALVPNVTVLAGAPLTVKQAIAVVIDGIKSAGVSVVEKPATYTFALDKCKK